LAGLRGGNKGEIAGGLGRNNWTMGPSGISFLRDVLSDSCVFAAALAMDFVWRRGRNLGLFDETNQKKIKKHTFTNRS
jgi:hypothetical protein